MDCIILNFNSEEMEIHWARNSLQVLQQMSSSTNLPYIFTQNQSMFPLCQLQKLWVIQKKNEKRVLFSVSEISKHQNVRSVATYVNFDIYKLG